MLTRPTYSGTEAAVSGAQFTQEQINDAMNAALGWMDLILKDLKDNSAWLNFTTTSATVYSVPQGVKYPILNVRYDAGDTAVGLERIVLKSNEDRRATREGSFFQPSPNQSFFADMESVGVDGIELFVNGGVEASKLVYYWCNLEFNRMTSDSDDLSLENRLDTILVDRATGICLRNEKGGTYLAQAQKLFDECDKMAALWNSWST